ncbi:MAG: phosphoribosyltransferase [Candidatus Diapherotrites archaeon]
MAEFCKKNREKKIFISWKKFDSLCRQLAKQVEKEFKPELIVAISRGGLVPAQIISHCIKNSELYVIKADYYKDDTAKKDMKWNTEPLITQKLDRQVEGKKILVVDEVTDSGATALMVKKYIDSLKPGEARYLTVHWKPWSKFKPHYFAEEADGWIVYPWAKKD